MSGVRFLLYFLLIFFHFFSYFLTPIFAQKKGQIEWKPWSEYTEQEKDSLRERWTDEMVDGAVKALKERKPLPSYVERLQISEGEPMKDYDLRGIPLQNHNLKGVELRSFHMEGVSLREAELQGAYLGGTNLEGADLRNAKMQGVYFGYANLKGAKLMKANLQVANLVGANLQAASLWQADLQRADLSYANLQEARLEVANLEGANLMVANLQRASVPQANLQEADLYKANLQGADIRWSNLQEVNLSQANLQGAKLEAANLRGANLALACFDTTYLALVNVGEAKNIRYIVWGNSLHKTYFIGEEKKANFTRSQLDFQIAENTYRDLKSFYEKVGMPEIVREFHFRENEVKTKSSSRFNPIRLLRLVFLKWTYGYSSRLNWLIRYSGCIIILFGVVFALLTLGSKRKPEKRKSGIYLIQSQNDKSIEILLPFGKGRLFLECLFFSLLSFATFGYGPLQLRQWLEFFHLEPLEYKPIRWARFFVWVEAAIGIWVLALLVTGLFGK